MDPRRKDLERDVEIRPPKKDGSSLDWLGFVGMLLGVLAMFFRVKAFAYLGICLHLASFAQMRFQDRDIKNVFTSLSVSVLAIFTIQTSPLPPTAA